MEWLSCKACGSNAIMPMDVSIDGADLDDLEDIEIEGFELHEEDGGNEEDERSDSSVFGLSNTSDESPSYQEDDQESKFFTCHVCGDNWLSVREDAVDASCHITFIHQMGMAPVLKRIAHMATHVVLTENTVDKWEYFLDDEQVEESVWLEKLAGRRKVLKSVCSN